MACWKKEKDALNPAECNNNSLTVISCLVGFPKRVRVSDNRGVECYILLVIKHHDSRKSSRYFRDGSDVVYVVGRVFLFSIIRVETKGFVVDNITVFCHENLGSRELLLLLWRLGICCQF